MDVSPRSPRVLESDLQARRAEFESYKEIKRTFKNIIKDIPLEENVKAITGLVVKESIHPFGKGLYFPFALQALKIKEANHDKWEEWIRNPHGIAQAAIQEYNEQRKIMKNGLRVILTSHLSKLESTHASENLKRKIEEVISNLSPYKDSGIDFKAILKILQNDDTDASPRKSPKTLIRRLSKRFKHKEIEKVDKTPIVQFADDRARSHSSPTIPSLVSSKTDHSKPRPNIVLKLFQDVLESPGLTVRPFGEAFKCSKGEFNIDTVKTILEAIEKIHNEGIEDHHLRQQLATVFNLLNSHPAAIGLLKKYPDQYSKFIKLCIHSEFVYWLLDIDKFQANLNLYHDWLQNNKIPNPYIVLMSEKVNLWTLFDTNESNQLIEHIKLLIDPCHSYQHAIDFRWTLFKKFTNLEHQKQNILNLRSKFSKSSDNHLDDLSFLTDICSQDESKQEMKLLSGEDNAFGQFCKLALQMNGLRKQIDEMEHYQGFPPLEVVQKFLEVQVANLLQCQMLLQLSLKLVVSELTKDHKEGDKFFELAKQPLLNFDEILKL